MNVDAKIYIPYIKLYLITYTFFLYQKCSFFWLLFFLHKFIPLQKMFFFFILNEFKTDNQKQILLKNAGNCKDLLFLSYRFEMVEMEIFNSKI